MLKSEKVIIEAPMSFTGSAKRAWKLTHPKSYVSTAPFLNKLGWFVAKVLLALLALIIIIVWWIAIVCWYLVFGLLVIPWRLFRRGRRRDKKRELQHRELLEQMKQRQG